MVNHWVHSKTAQPVSPLEHVTLRLPGPFMCLMIGNAAPALLVQAGASPGRGESLCLQLAVS